MTNLFRPPKNQAQKLTFIMSSITVSLMLFAYQNCGKINSGSGLPEGSVEQKPAVLNLDSNAGLTLLKNDQNLEMNAYKVNLATGEVERTLYEVPSNDPANKPQLLCLSDAQRAELEDLMNKSSVCFYQSSNPQAICTQEYKYPYAIADKYKLGENAKPCSDFYDLCKADRDAFVAAITDILATIDQSTCN